MEQKKRPRAASFLLVMSWIYLVLGVVMIAFALYEFTSADVKLTFDGVTNMVFLLIDGVLGLLAGIFGLVSKNLKRCRIIGLVLLFIAAIPLAINLLAGLTFKAYWKNVAVMILPFLYLMAALIKRSEKKPPDTQAQPAQTSAADNTKYAVSTAKSPVAKQPVPAAQETEPTPEPLKNE
jgi:peptidoglycan/LPS O-acetylase OafA/YrhL